MRRFKLLPLLLAALLPALSACAPSAPPAPGSAVSLSAQAETALTVTDDLGREVEVPFRPRRVAALIGSFADIWTLAGGGESLAAAAEDSWTSFDLDLGEEVVHLGSAKDPSLEAILSAQPELILASTDTGADLELLPTFEELGCPALYFRVETFSDYLRMLELCTRLTGQPENYRRYGLQVQEQVEAALGRQEGSSPSVLYIRASSTVSRAKGSQGNVLGEMLRALGCRNIADGREELLEDLSLEAILAEDPAYIFIVYQAADPAKAQALLEETLLSEPAWASLRAVREGRCFVLDQRLYNLKPNARWGEAYEQLAELLYGG